MDKYGMIYNYSMIDLKPNHYVIRNGKLQQKNGEELAQTYRVIPYPHTVRIGYNDYYNNTLLQYRKEIQQLKKNYAQLQKTYWELLQEKKLSQFLPSHHRHDFLHPNFEENSTMIQSREVQQSQMLNTHDHVNQNLAENNCLSLYKSPLKISTMCSSYILEEKQTDKSISEESEECGKNLTESKDRIQEDQTMRDFYLKTMKQMESVLEIQRKNAQILRNRIEKLREQISQKDDILRQASKENVDPNSMRKKVKSMNLNI